MYYGSDPVIKTIIPYFVCQSKNNLSAERFHVNESSSESMQREGFFIA